MTIVTDNLLQKAADSFMNLGNVTYSNTNEQHYTQAIAYLRKAQNVLGYRLPSHLSEYVSRSVSRPSIQIIL